MPAAIRAALGLCLLVSPACPPARGDPAAWPLVGGRSCPAPYDSIAYGTCGAPPATTNGPYTLSDLVIQSTDPGHAVTVTAIPALAGAVASVKIAGRELIATGGTGSSFQYDIHPSYPALGLVQSECDNPTEAGAETDWLSSSGPPWLGVSSSRVQIYWSGLNAAGVPQIAVQSDPAYFVPKADPALSSRAGCAAYRTSRGPVAGVLSGFTTTKWMTLGTTVGGSYLPTVMQVDLQVRIPRPVPVMDVQVVAYLQDSLATELVYDPLADAETLKPPGAANGTTSFHNSNIAPVIRIISTADRAYGVGVITPPIRLDPKESRLPTEYTTTDLDQPPGSTYPFRYRLVGAVHYFARLHPYDTIVLRTFFAFGSVAYLEGIARVFARSP